MNPTIRFCTIVSGSSGNCAYAELLGQHLIIDAGLSGKRLMQGLSQLNVSKPTAILLTHEHSDHIAGAGVIARRFDIPIYATPLTWRYFLRHKKLGPLKEEQVRHIIPGQPVMIGQAKITAFDVPHDASQPVGYTLEAAGVKIAYTTDLGSPTATVAEHLRGAQVLLIESNHDLEMLQNGRYPPDLKKRVAGARGHLSNAAAGQLIVEVAWDGLKHVILGHLSEENNRPMLAYDTVGRILDTHEVKVNLAVADRHYLGDLIEL
ncbi:MAG: MBL fold metallo-hydrolase [Defluviitaleaceae bacterium]|nr:MBL fold metallo-hydrolase [Defluviitaleaceae bacterium]